MMKIGEISMRTGIPVTTIRYYEKVGLLPSPDRLQSGYRVYGKTHLDRLVFLNNVRKLGFSQPRIKQLASLLEHPGRANRQVRESVQAQLEEVRRKRILIQGIEEQLTQLVVKCEGSKQTQCPILETLQDEA